MCEKWLADVWIDSTFGRESAKDGFDVEYRASPSLRYRALRGFILCAVPIQSSRTSTCLFFDVAVRLKV